MIAYRIVQVLVYLICVNNCYGINRPVIKSINGHLSFNVPPGKNIFFETSEKGSIHLNSLNLNEISQMSKNVSRALSKYQTSFDATLEKIHQLENHFSEVPSSRNSTTLYPLDPSSVTRSVRRLNRRVNVLSQRFRLFIGELEEDKCTSNPCRNGGTCIPLYKNYHCQCPPEWEGKSCDKDTNECARYIGTDLGCQNGATCINKPGSYECLCTHEWFGVHCTRRSSDCNSGSSSELCGHGTCISQNSPLGYTCLCDQGWTTDGKTPVCNTDVNECTSNRPQCSVNPPVACINSPGSFSCGTCPEGYTGNGYYCQDIDECENNNGGCSTNPKVQCVNTMGSSYCSHCPPGYSGDGKTCNYLGVCNVNNGGCSPLATCKLSSGFVQCTCPVKYTGTGIGLLGCTKTSTSPCDPNPCMFGTCLVVNSTYQCRCFSGFSGPLCISRVSSCASNPCRNGGTCVISLYNRYRCICTSSFTGAECQREVEACGGRLNTEAGSIAFPSLSGQSYGNHISCAWTISTNISKVLNITFTKFNLETSSKCQFDWLQVHDGQNTLSPSLGRFCGNQLPNGGTIVSTHNVIYLWFRSDHSIGKDGFQLNWTSIAPVCGDLVMVESHGIIKSPGSPGFYPYNRDCYWNLQAPVGKRFLFHFFTLMIGNSSNCNEDYLAFYSDNLNQGSLFAKFCNSSHPAPIYSPASSVIVHFHSDQTKSYPGFQISYALDNAIPGCGGIFTADEGEIRSPKYDGKYPANLECEYKIKVAIKNQIRITFISFDIEESENCQFDSVSIYSGSTTTGSLIARHCGGNIPPSYTSEENKILIVFKSDWATHNEGFVLNYKVLCGGKFTDLSGVITSPGYPLRTPSKDCIYEIMVPLNYKIVLHFTALDMEQNSAPLCIYDFLEVRDGDNENSTLIGKYCEKAPGTIFSTYNHLWIRFKTDPSDTGLGFSANYTTRKLGCGGILKGKSGSISSHDSRDQYAPMSYCQWIISAPSGYVIQISFLLFDIEKSYHCSFDYIEIFDNNTDPTLGGSMGKFCGHQVPPFLITSSNIASLKFVSDGTVNAGGFLANYHTILESNVCGGNYFTRAGVIKSPRYPRNYPENTECNWSINVDPGQQIMLNVTDFQIESFSSCKYDWIEIRNGGTKTSPLIGRYCGTTIPKLIPSHSNKLFINFKSDITKNDRGFKITWDSTSTACGGTLNSPTGSIISPNYPEPYYANGECLWKISVSAGSAIQVVFSDLELEAHNSCLMDYIEIYDGPTITSKSLGRFCNNHPPFINSTGNTITIKFRSDVSQQGRGFQLQYNTLCNITLHGFGGVIESPNFPNNYPFNLNCNWIIKVDSKNNISITFSHLDLEYVAEVSNKSKNCAYDYIKIEFEPPAPDFEDPLPFQTFGTYCGTNLPEPLHLEADKAKIQFVSDNLLHGSGFRLEWQLDGCGGFLTKPNGTISSPNYPKPYQAKTECHWQIEVNYGESIEITFHEVDVEKSTGCNLDFMEVFNGEDDTYPSLAKLCHATKPITITSTGNFMYLSFKSDYSYQGKGFLANYTSLQSKCGGKYNANFGTITSPNYPKNHDVNETCGYLIEVNEGHMVALNFKDLNLIKEAHQNCSSPTVSTVKVFDGPSPAYPVLGTLCGHGAPNITYTSTLNQMFVELVTVGNFVSKGFKATYKLACGGRIKTTSFGEIKLEAGDLYNEDSSLIINNCSWTIIADDPSKHVSLTVTYFDATSSFTNYGLAIYNGFSNKAPLIETYDGVKVPPTLTSEGNALYIDLAPNSHLYATYSIYDSACGGTIKSSEGQFSSPGYPKSYPASTECEWTITVPQGNAIRINFDYFNLPKSEHCNSDYLEVRRFNSSGSLLGVFCGDDAPVNLTNIGTLWMFLKTSENVQESQIKQGFLGEFDLQHETSLTGSFGIIESPKTVYKYLTISNFAWRITVDFRKKIQITFKNMGIMMSGIYDSGECWISLSIYDGPDADSPVLGQFCGSEIPEPVTSSSNVVFLSIAVYYENDQFEFMLEWLQIDSARPLPNQSTRNLTSCGTSEPISLNNNNTLARIKSPGYPNGYDTNLKCEWIITTDPMNHLKFWFHAMNFDESYYAYYAGCISDYVEISEKGVTGDWISKNKICKENQTGISYHTSNIVKLTFVSNNYQNGSGFYASVFQECGGTLTESSGFIIHDNTSSNSNPAMNSLTCEWNVTVRSGRTIEVKFIKLKIAQITDTCNDYVMLRNGKYRDSPILGDGKYCGTKLPPVLKTIGNNLYVKYYSSFGAEFIISYREVSNDCHNDILLNEFSNTVDILSPNYPSIPNPHTECIWRIMAPPGERIRLDFKNLFLFSSKECTQEYVEVRDGGTITSRLIGRYCGNSPSSQFSTDNMIFIKFFTDVDDPGTGFKATASISKCGGTFYGDHVTVTSPYFKKPDLYPTNANCTWYIHGPKFHQLSVIFNMLDIGNSLNCSGSDSLTISEPSPENNDIEKVIGRFCGGTLPPNISSSGRDIIVRFQSGKIAQYRKGFSLTTNTSLDTCGGNFEASEGFIQSPNYPNTQTKRVCRYLITVPKGRRVTLQFLDLDIHPSLVKTFLTGIMFYNNKFKSYIGSVNDPFGSNLLNVNSKVQSSDNTLYVHYWLSTGSVSRGFKARFTSNEPTICEGNFDQDYEGVITQPKIKMPSYACTYYRNKRKTTIGTTLVLKIDAKSNMTQCRGYYGNFQLKADDNKIIGTACAPIQKTIRSPFTVHELEILKNQYYDLNYTITYNIYQCGGIITKESSIISIGSKQESLECVWLITIPKEQKISLNITDLKLGDDCSKSFLNIYNGDLPTKPIIGHYCKSVTPDPFISESNSLWIEYKADVDSNSKGFSLNYVSVEDGCGGVFHNRERNIQTPKYPSSYPNNAECLWEIHAEGGYHIGLMFDANFQIEKTSNCSNDYVEIWDWKKGDWISFGRFCGREIHSFNSTSNKMKILFRSNGDTPGRGFMAKWEWNCGGTFIADSTKRFIVSPNYPRYYSKNLYCEYNISAPGKHIFINFIDFELEGVAHFPCRQDNVSISSYYNWQYNLYSKQYCGDQIPPDIRIYNQIYVKFQTNNVLERKGFHFSYQVYDCGGNITEPSTIESPSLNKQNSQMFLTNVQCLWMITAPPKKQIVVNFEYFRFTYKPRCYYDSVEIYEGLTQNTANKLGSFCGDLSDNLPVIKSVKNTLSIKLMTDANINRRGFKANVYFTDGPESGCGGVLNITNKPFELSAPNLENSDCIWTLLSPSDTYIKIKFTELNLPNSCNFGSNITHTACSCSVIELKDGALTTSETIERLCGLNRTHLDREFTTSLNRGVLRLYAKNSKKSGFTASITSQPTICGKSFLNVTKSVQILTSPNYPNPYPNDVNCNWYFSSTKRFQLHFVDFELDNTQNCNEEQLKVVDNTQTIIYEGLGPTVTIGGNKPNSTNFHTFQPHVGIHKFCGNSNKPFDYYSNLNSLSVQFKSTNVPNRKHKGFKIEYHTNGCNRNYTSLDGRILHSEDNDCYTTITVPKNFTISIYFQWLMIMPTSNCKENYLEVRDGQDKNGRLLNRLCGYAIPGPIFSQSNKIWMHSHTQQSYTQQSLLNPNYDIVYTSSDQGPGCGGTLYNYKGRFSSPMYPGVYKNTKLCQWKIYVPEGMKIALKFEVFDLDDSCDNNYLKVSFGDDDQHKFCKTDTPAVLYSSKMVSVSYQSSLNNNGRGFLALFEAVH